MHILKAYLDCDPSRWCATIRTCVDDITLSYVGASARDVARVLAKELPLLKRSLLSRCMASNAAKEQLYSPTVGVLQLWKRTQRTYAGTLSKKAKDLGVAQRGVSIASHIRKTRLGDMKCKARRVSTLRSWRSSRITITQVGLHTSSMYGCEVDPLTLDDTKQLRLGAAAGLHLDWGPNNRIAAMLLTPPGLLEPKALYLDRVMLNWCRQVTCGMGPSKDLCLYWTHARSDQGRAKGPIHLVTQNPETMWNRGPAPNPLGLSPIRIC